MTAPPAAALEGVRIGCTDARHRPVRCADATAPRSAVLPAPRSATRPSPSQAARKAPAAAPRPTPDPKRLGPEEIGELIKRARDEEDLAITGEQSAHRVQVRIHLELEKTLDTQAKERLKQDPRYDYLSFITELWVDRLRSRFPTKEEFGATFSKKDHRVMAETAYQELVDRSTRPGSPHLDRHVRDFYRTVTEEKFVEFEVEKRRRVPGISAAGKERDAKLLKEAAKIIAEADAKDGEFRKAKGYPITGDEL